MGPSRVAPTAGWTVVLALVAITTVTTADANQSGLHLADDNSEIRFGRDADSTLRRAGPGLLALDGALAVCGGIHDGAPAAAGPPGTRADPRRVLLTPGASATSVSWPTSVDPIVSLGSDFEIDADTTVAPSHHEWSVRPASPTEPYEKETAGGIMIPETGLYRLTLNTDFDRSVSSYVQIRAQQGGRSLTPCSYTAQRAGPGASGLEPQRSPLRFECFFYLFAGDSVYGASGPSGLRSDATHLLIRKVRHVMSFRADLPVLSSANGLLALGGNFARTLTESHVPDVPGLPSSAIGNVVQSGDAFVIQGDAAWYRVDLSFTMQASPVSASRSPVDLSIAVRRVSTGSTAIKKECRAFVRFSEAAMNASISTYSRIHKTTACYLFLEPDDQVSIVPTADTELVSMDARGYPGVRLGFERVTGSGVSTAPPQIAALKYSGGGCHPTQHAYYDHSSVPLLQDMSTVRYGHPSLGDLPAGQTRLLFNVHGGIVVVDGDPTTHGLYEVDLIYHHRWNGTADEATGAPFDLAVGVWRQGTHGAAMSNCRLQFKADGADALHADSTYHTTCLVSLQGQDQIQFYHRRSNCLQGPGDVMLFVRQL